MISENEVHKIASLSRIYLQDQEAQELSKHLEKILHYVEKLNELDVNQVKPTSYVLPLKNITREDKIIPSLDANQALKTATEKHNGSFKVPKVIECD